MWGGRNNPPITNVVTHPPVGDITNVVTHPPVGDITNVVTHLPVGDIRKGEVENLRD